MSGLVGTSSSRSKTVGRSIDTAKFWVSWDMTAAEAVAERSSYNIDCVDDAGAGNWNVNFSCFKDANYCAVTGAELGGYWIATKTDVVSSTQCKINCWNGTTWADCSEAYMIGYGE